jgi:predicted enzyme related to lactoylglutathione lyase/catechol 2,3-dioxygenase-like lactoylglutathione lyase family enzyme
MKKLVAVAILLLASQFARAQAPEPAGLIVGSGNFFSPIVGDLDKAIAFYRDGLGLDIQGAPANAEQNAPLRNMFGLPDAQLRWAVGRPPAMRTGVEIVEIKKADGKPVERRVQDPGAFTLIVLVRDIDAAFAKVKQVSAPVVTAGGRPIAVGRAKAFVVKDPDGHFVEVAQLTPLPDTQAPDTANVIGVRVRVTVEDAGQSMRQYQALGLKGTMNVIFDKNDALMRLFGLKEDVQYRLAAMDVPTTGLKLEFIEFKGVDRRTLRANIQDPGSTRMQLQVRDVDATIEALKTGGGSVVSTGGTTVELPGRGGATTKVAIVRDPSNLFLVLLQAAPRP